MYTQTVQLAAARARCSAKLHVSNVYLGMRAKQTVSPEGNALSEALAFLDVLEEHEDVQHVFRISK